MSKIQENIKFSLESVVNSSVLYSKLSLCNLGNSNIIISSDAILLNDMYSNYPFYFSMDLRSKCEFDFSMYKKANISIASNECVNKTWDHSQECNFYNINHGNYSVRFEQVIECYDLENNLGEKLLLGENSSFVL